MTMSVPEYMVHLLQILHWYKNTEASQFFKTGQEQVPPNKDGHGWETAADEVLKFTIATSLAFQRANGADTTNLLPNLIAKIDQFIEGHTGWKHPIDGIYARRSRLFALLELLQETYSGDEDVTVLDVAANPTRI